MTTAMHKLPEGWDGKDRRGPSCEDKFFKLMQDHTEDEMDRYDQIINKINANDSKSDNRHNETQKQLGNLAMSIHAFISGNEEFMASIKRAFPKDDDGKPDYDGHRSAHLAWISDAKDEKEVMEYVRRQMKDEVKTGDLKEYVKKVVLAAIAVALSSWLIAIVWQGALHGPVK